MIGDDSLTDETREEVETEREATETSEGDIGGDLQRFSADRLPPLDDFVEVRRTETSFAYRVQGPFQVETKPGEWATCEDGWLMLDSEGAPYPCKATVFADTYEPALPDEPERVEPVSPPPSEAPAVDTGPIAGTPTDADAGLIDQLAHRVTYLEAALTLSVTQLVSNGVLPRDFVSDLTRQADRRLRELADRARTPGRSQLIGVDLQVAREG